MGDTVGTHATWYVYKDVTYGICCAGCGKKLKNETEQVLNKHHNKLIGYSLYDPVSQERVKADKANAYSDYKSVRYFFVEKKNKAVFDKDPKKYTSGPNYEALGTCVMTGEEIPLGKAGAYRDVETTIDGKKQMARVYFCCVDCVAGFEKDRAAHLKTIKFVKAELREVK